MTPLAKNETAFLQTQTNKTLLFLTIILSLVYFVVLAFWLPRGNAWMFGLLVAGEIFHLWQAMTFVFTVWNTDAKFPKDENFQPAVDIYITVAGEPVEIVEATARAAKNLDYPRFKVYLLNDGKVVGKENWQAIENLAGRLDIYCITRETPGGAKAGNINNALAITSSPFVAIFDADQVPNEDFLQKTVGYFYDSQVAFVQSPQYYKNSALNEVTGGAWEQQEIFFGPISKGKNRSNAAFMCGTNMVIRKSALAEVGGMCEDNIAEDFLTSLFIHQKGYKSIYVPEVLAAGLAPEDFYSYYKQQFRWARGSLEMVFRHNPLLKKGLTMRQRIEYLASATYYLSGVVVILNAVLPLIFFFTGRVPLNVSTMFLAMVFLPYILLVVINLKLASNFTYTFRALAFSAASFPIHIKALWAVLTGQKTNFDVTSKQGLNGNFLQLSIPHIAYIMLGLIGLEVAILREGLSAAVLANSSWVLFNIAAFMPFVVASAPEIFKKSAARTPAAGSGQIYSNAGMPAPSDPALAVIDDKDFWKTPYLKSVTKRRVV